MNFDENNSSMTRGNSDSLFLSIFPDNVYENPSYLKEQLITYLGNKRTLLPYIVQKLDYIRRDIDKPKMITLDLFSGSGVVSRLLKQYSEKVFSNDLEAYSKCINQCYLSNKEELDPITYNNYLNQIVKLTQEYPIKGFVSKMYAPEDESNIKLGERVFYTIENAKLIDSYRYYIDEVVPVEIRKFFIARLLVESSVHVNTSGVFKGFYKDKETKIGKYGGSGENALHRIRGKIELTMPVLSSFSCDYEVIQDYAENTSKRLKGLDVAYLDPPYNQHPYGSNYFMLNLILNNQAPVEYSKVSGIPTNWNKSKFNSKKDVLFTLEDIISCLDAKYIVVSYNNEGFISFDDMKNMLSKYGTLQTEAIHYNTFRGCRNLNNRNIHTNEYLFTLKKH